MKQGFGVKHTSSLTNLKNYRPTLNQTPPQHSTPQHLSGDSRDLYNNSQSTGTSIPPQTLFSEYNHSYDLTPSGIQRLLKEQQRSGSMSPKNNNDQQRPGPQSPLTNISSWLQR